MKRRDFLKWSAAGMATIVVGSKLNWLCGEAQAAHIASGQTIKVTISDAIKEMVTHNAGNPAECYFWGYHMHVNNGTTDVEVPYECPGPTILITQGENFTFEITNTLDEPHALFIPGMFNSADAVDITNGTTKYANGIPPGKTVRGSFTATNVGAFLYYDNLNEPVNRVMGLHGAFIVQPATAKPGHKFTPYDPALVSDGVQKMYDDFGNSTHFPGLAWEQGDNLNDPTILRPAPPFRTYAWVTHQASPKLFAEVGNWPAGQDYPAQLFVDKFLNSQFSPTNDARGGYTPQFFTINGQSGMFAHFGPYNTPMGRVGEPVVVHILNAGLWTHSMHLHANHFYVTASNGVVSENPIWVDVYNVKPMDRVDYTIPFMRPPDLPNVRGIGFPDQPLVSPTTGRPVWPCVEELDMYIPGPGEKMAQRADGTPVDLKQRMSPLCYPMHDHSEPSQTAQGGNYNCGLISGIYFVGDRNAASQGLGNHLNFPMDEDFQMMYRNIRGCYPGVWPPAGDTEATGYPEPQ